LTNSHPLSTATFSITIRIDWFFGRTWRTDTQPNPTEFDCRDHARRGISTSTYGLGHHFNEDVVLAMAKAGRGNAYYGQTAADFAEPFQAELALLTNLCTHGVVLTVTAPADVNVELRNDCEPLEGEPHAWKWPDVGFGADAWTLLQFTIPVARLVAGSTPDLPIAISVRAGGAGSTPLFIVATLPPVASRHCRRLGRATGRYAGRAEQCRCPCTRAADRRSGLAHALSHPSARMAGSSPHVLEVVMAPSLHAMLSRHARARMQQRGIAPDTVETVLQYGHEQHDRHGGLIVYLDKRSRGRMQRTPGVHGRKIDMSSGVFVVLTAGGTVLTVGHRYRRVKRH
jgi:hypothetical protein